MSNRTQVCMVLAQNRKTLESRMYPNFRKRALSRTKDNWYDRGDKPKGFRILRKGSLFELTTEFVVVFGSFTQLFANDDPKKETGFTILFKDIDGKKLYKLTVLKSNNAYYERYKK